MRTGLSFSRRGFLASAAAAFPLSAATAFGAKKIPVGLELYSVRHELEKNEMSTLEQLAKMGYECVEFYSPYVEWTPEHAKEVRKRLDGLGMKCYSTHNSLKSFEGDGMAKALDLNGVLGAKSIVLASAGEVTSLDGWKKVAEKLNAGNQHFKKAGVHAGYHNHQVEWKSLEGQVPLQVLAESTDKSVMMQLDVGTCMESGADPVAWINSHPGRIRSLHLKDWSPQNGYQVLFGEGKSPWKEILAAAEKRGGVEFYLIEQEGSRFPEFETADRCLVAFRDLKS